MKIMRKTYIYIIGGLCLLGGLASCSDFLDIKDPKEIVLEDFWKEKADVDGIVAGCYARMQSDDVIRRMMVWGEFRSENVAPGPGVNDDGHLENLLKENITAMNAYTAWDGFYTVINRCNTVLKYAPEVAATDPGYTKSELKETIAEVSALRDLCYFYLIRTFRDVPYSTVAYTDDDQPMNLPATPFNAVLDSLILDLENVVGDARELYPVKTSGVIPQYQTGRITKNAIHAMLCEMYLWKKDYDKCIEYADLVINFKKEYAKKLRQEGGGSAAFGSAVVDNEGRMSGFPLVGNGSNNTYGTGYKTLFLDGSTVESIFELIYNTENAGVSGIAANSAVGALYGNSSVTKGMVIPSKAIVDNNDIFEDVKKLDARMYENASLDAECIVKYVYKNVTIVAGTSSTPSATISVPFGYDTGKKVHYNGSNWIIYRLPDIMLLKAEALCQKMQEGSTQEVIEYNRPLLDEAFFLVNAINKRSLCQTPLKDTLVRDDYTTKVQMEELVMKERQRELMFEGKRWYDLVRRSMRDGNTDELVKAAQNRDGVDGSYLGTFFSKMDAIFWPYNIEETKVNKNLVQNPAFSSGENQSYSK